MTNTHLKRHSPDIVWACMWELYLGDSLNNNSSELHAKVFANAVIYTHRIPGFALVPGNRTFEQRHNSSTLLSIFSNPPLVKPV